MNEHSAIDQGHDGDLARRVHVTKDAIGLIPTPWPGPDHPVEHTVISDGTVRAVPSEWFQRTVGLFILGLARSFKARFRRPACEKESRKRHCPSGL